MLLGVERDDLTRDIEAEAKTGKKCLTIQIQKNIEGIAVCYRSAPSIFDLANVSRLATIWGNKAEGDRRGNRISGLVRAGHRIKKQDKKRTGIVEEEYT